MNKYEFHLNEGQFEIHGLPAGCFIRCYDSKAARRLVKLRLAEQNLIEARCYLEQMQFYEKQPIVLEALASSATNSYAACFQSGKLSAKLNAKQVFDFDHEALARHQEWMRIRHLRLHHQSEIGREVEYCAAFDEECKFVDGLVLVFDLPLHQMTDWLGLLFNLIHRAKEYVDQAVEASFQRVKREVSDLTCDDIHDLPTPELNRPEY